MSQKQSILGSKIDFRVRQSYHFLIFDVPAFILLDLKKHCQAFPSTANSIPNELPTAQYSSYQARFSLT